MISYLECYNYCDILLWWIRLKLPYGYFWHHFTSYDTSCDIMWHHVMSYHVIHHKNHNKVLQTIWSYSGLFEVEADCNIAWQRKISKALRDSFTSGRKIAVLFSPTNRKCPIFENFGPILVVRGSLMQAINPIYFWYWFQQKYNYKSYKNRIKIEGD